jgi:hypothetical protein
MRAPEGPVQVLVVRGQDVDLGENAGHSFVAFSWYARGVSDGADGSLSVEGVRDLVGDSIAASAGVADRLAAAGTMTIGSTSVEAMAVTLGDGLTARVGAVARLTRSTVARAGYGLLHGVQLLDTHTGRQRRFDYGEHVVAEEHVLVPKPGQSGELDAWLLGTTYDARRQATVLNLLDAAHIEDGPLAQAVLPYALPLGFHGNFTAA